MQFLWESGGDLKDSIQYSLANVDTCVKNWKIGVENCKHDPMGEDLFADIGMRKNEVTGTEVFDITKCQIRSAKILKEASYFPPTETELVNKIDSREEPVTYY